MQCVFIQDHVRKKPEILRRLWDPARAASALGLAISFGGNRRFRARGTNHLSPLTSPSHFSPFDALDACSGQAFRIRNAPYRPIPVLGH